MKHLLLLFAVSISLIVNGQINVLPYEQPFDDTTIPEYWTQLDHQGDGQIWQFGTDLSTGGDFWYPSPVLNGNYAILNSDAYGEAKHQNVDLISPTFDLTGKTSVYLHFTHFLYNYNGTTATLSYSIDNGGSWFIIQTWTESSANPEIFNMEIPEVANQSEVQFKWNYNATYQWGWAIDDVGVSAPTNATWTGAVSTAWNDAANWSNSVIPGLSTNVTIPVTSYSPLVAGSATCLDLSMIAGTNLTINPGSNLSVFGQLELTKLFIKSDVNGTGSLIANSVTGSGTADIERYMTQNLWHNVGSPVSQSESSFLQFNTEIPTKNVSSRGMMDYNTGTDNWNDYFDNDSPNMLEVGKGYAIRTTSDTHVTFSGAINTSAVNVPLSADGNGWNLVGNPYTSAIKLNHYSGPNNFLDINEDELDPFFVAIYYWDGVEYQKINDVGTEFASIAQGFFVKSKPGGGNLSFTPDMQIHQPFVALKAGKVEISGIKLQASTSKKSSSTDIKFLSNGTTGLDKGYDAGIFKADATFSIFTKLIDDNNVNIGFQCLPVLSAETMIIPVGIDFPEGGEVTFTAQMLSIPEKSSIILEDRLLNKTTSFTDASSHYTTTVAANSIPTGRFYLHVSGNAQVTGINQSIENKINAWMEKDEIVVNGITENNAVAKLFDIRGSSVIVRYLDKTATNRINVNGITSGIYMLQVIENGKRTGIKIQINGK